MDKNNIIMITGLHGCGKSTQIRLIKMYLENIGKKVYVSKADNGINLKNLLVNMMVLMTFYNSTFYRLEL